MGYGNTIMLVFGVKLTNEETALLQKELDIAKGEIELIDDFIYNLIPKDKIIMKQCGNHILPERYYGGVWSEGTDSRIHSLCINLEDSDTHYFGIYIAGNGYACSDDIARMMVTEHKQATDNFNEYILPFLEKSKITKKPKMEIFQQGH